ncbi:hypothetical protein PIB30_087272 [Stylosanthes scabra]|uniref:Uncharacterized protein n=1 Tax=Stylosanthes scabra TaxID=79078 RepID=A0ABU6ZS18_9FABA|nr:hypothetical protein [Stylosanthes scabra]
MITWFLAFDIALENGWRPSAISILRILALTIAATTRGCKFDIEHIGVAVRDRRSFMLMFPQNTGVAVLPHRFYYRYQRRLGVHLLFVDAQGDSHRLMLHKGTFAGSGLGELMAFYRISNGGTIHAKYVGHNILCVCIVDAHGQRVW